MLKQAGQKKTAYDLTYLWKIISKQGDRKCGGGYRVLGGKGETPLGGRAFRYETKAAWEARVSTAPVAVGSVQNTRQLRD